MVLHTLLMLAVLGQDLILNNSLLDHVDYQVVLMQLHVIIMQTQN